MSKFDSVVQAPAIEVFNVNKLANEDQDPNKVNLSIGAYRTEEGKPWVLPVVRTAEEKLAKDNTLDHEYLPVLGFENFTKEASSLLLGADHAAIKEGRDISALTLTLLPDMKMTHDLGVDWADKTALTPGFVSHQRTRTLLFY